MVGKASVNAAIETPRLLLVRMSLADAAALVNGHQPADARWAAGYPTDGTLVAAGFVVTAQAEGRALGPWTSYQIVRRSDGLVMGDCGFLGPPDHHGWVHVGYGVADARRDLEDATEALAALIEWARSQPEVTRVLADTAYTNAAAIRVMEGAGMRRAGSDRSLVYFEA